MGRDVPRERGSEGSNTHHYSYYPMRALVGNSTFDPVPWVSSVGSGLSSSQAMVPLCLALTHPSVAVGSQLASPACRGRKTDAYRKRTIYQSITPYVDIQSGLHHARYIHSS